MSEQPHLTKLLIYLAVDEEIRTIQEAIGGLPGYCSESFREHSPGSWNGEFIVTCPVAPHLADGDFVDELAPYFPELLKLKTFHDAAFELQIAVGAPGPEGFELESHMVAMLAALGARIRAIVNPPGRNSVAAES